MQKILIVAERGNATQYAYADSFVAILRAVPDVLVESFDPTIISLQGMRRRLWALPRGVRQAAQQYRMHQLATLITQQKFSTILVIKGDQLPTSVLQRARDCGTRLVLFYPDNPFMMSNGNSHQGVVQNLPLFDIVWSWGKFLQPVFTSVGVRHSCYVPFCYDEQLFSGVSSASPELIYDLVFCATADDERAQWLHEFSEVAQQFRVAIWGNRWPEFFSRFPHLKKWYQGPAIYGQQMAEKLQQSVAALNLIRLQNYSSHNMRTFELPACFAMQLTTDTPEQRDFFADSISYFTSPADAAHQLRELQKNPEQRHAMMLHAHQRAQNYTLQKMLASEHLEKWCLCGVF